MEFDKLRKIIWEYTGSFFSQYPIIIQAGAHQGEVCIDKFKLYPTSTIYAFEPCKKSYNICNDRIKNEEIKNVTLFNIGLSNIDSTGILNISTTSNTNSLYKVNNNLPYKTTSDQTNETEIINMINLSNWCSNNNISVIDLLYLNIEGHELKALEGSCDILKNVKTIAIEVNFVEIWTNTPLFNELDAFLKKHNFYLSMHDCRPYYNWTNIQHLAIYINKSLYSSNYQLTQK